MKKLITILLLLPLFCGATILKVGSTGYVNVSGQNYSRANVSTYYQVNRAGDSTVQLTLPIGTIAGQVASAFLDGDNGNTPFTSMAALTTWLDANFEPVVAGGTVTSVTSGNLTPIFTSSVATGTTTPAITYSMTPAAAYTVLTNSTNATAVPAYQKVVPLAMYSTAGTPSSSTFYRGDGQWQTPSASITAGVTAIGSGYANGNVVFDGGGTLTENTTFRVDVGTDAVLMKLATITDGATIGGVAVPTNSSTTTFTNKWIQIRDTSYASSATPTVSTDRFDQLRITALAAAITSMTTGLSGTPVQGQMLVIEITDNGTARAITWGASFENGGITSLPTTTVISTLLGVVLKWNSATSKWRCVGTY